MLLLQRARVPSLVGELRNPHAPWQQRPKIKEYFTVFVFFFFFAMRRGMWDLSSPTRDGTRAPRNGSMES